MHDVLAVPQLDVSVPVRGVSCIVGTRTVCNGSMVSVPVRGVSCIMQYGITEARLRVSVPVRGVSCIHLPAHPAIGLPRFRPREGCELHRQSCTNAGLRICILLLHHTAAIVASCHFEVYGAVLAGILGGQKGANLLCRRAFLGCFLGGSRKITSHSALENGITGTHFGQLQHTSKGSYP